MLVEANETFLKKDKAIAGRSLVQASKNVFVGVMKTRKQPRFSAYLRLTRLPSTSNILFCKSIKPAFDLK
jgi:hypothetical protein